MDRAPCARPGGAGRATRPLRRGPLQESFDSTPPGSLPAGWSQWSSGAASFAVSTAQPESGPAGLASSGASNVTARGWLATSQPADVQASADVFVNALTGTQVLVRGSNLSSDSPTYYALTIRRGLYAQLVRVVNGTTTVLADLSSTTWFEGKSARLTLTANGNKIAGPDLPAGHRAVPQRLRQSGSPQATAFSVTDSVDQRRGLRRRRPHCRLCRERLLRQLQPHPAGKRNRAGRSAVPAAARTGHPAARFLDPHRRAGLQRHDAGVVRGPAACRTASIWW